MNTLYHLLMIIGVIGYLITLLLITPHVNTNYSPFKLVFGKISEVPCKNIMTDSSIWLLILRWNNSLENARKMIETTIRNRSLESYTKMNNIDLSIGDLVLMQLENRKKYEAPYNGPYEITDTDNTTAELILNWKKNNCS